MKTEVAIKAINNLYGRSSDENKKSISRECVDDVCKFLSMFETDEQMCKEFYVDSNEDRIAVCKSIVLKLLTIGKQNVIGSELIHRLICSQSLTVSTTMDKYTYLIYFDKLSKFLTGTELDVVERYISRDEYELMFGKSKKKESSMRDSSEYKKWINLVLDRDERTCQCCGSKINPEVHHILNYSQHKDLRIDVSNGITLCQCCHSPMIVGSFHNTYGTRNNTREQLAEYINNKRKSLGI